MAEPLPRLQPTSGGIGICIGKQQRIRHIFAPADGKILLNRNMIPAQQPK